MGYCGLGLTVDEESLGDRVDIWVWMRVGVVKLGWGWIWEARLAEGWRQAGNGTRSISRDIRWSCWYRQLDSKGSTAQETRQPDKPLSLDLTTTTHTPLTKSHPRAIQVKCTQQSELRICIPPSHPNHHKKPNPNTYMPNLTPKKEGEQRPRARKCPPLFPINPKTPYAAAPPCHPKHD